MPIPDPGARVIDETEFEQQGIGLRHYLDVVRRRKWIALAVTATAIGAAALFSFLQDPTYRASTKIVVGQGNSLFPPGEASAVQPFTATMGDLVRSNVVARTVIDSLGLTRESPESLLSRVAVSINPETAVVKVSVEDGDKQRAVAIAQGIGLVFSQLVKDRFGTPPATADRGVAQLPLTATIFDPAHAEPQPVSPRPKRNMAIAGVLGLLLGVLAGFLREHFDRMLRTRESIEQGFGVPVIGQIPFERKGKDNQRTVFWDGFGETVEAFRALRANLQYLAVKRPLQTILVTSASPNQGKTTVAANLAVAIARSGATTVVLEGDLRRPRLDETFGAVGGGAGLTSVLVGAADLEDAIVDISVPEAADGAGQLAGHVALIPSGPLPPNPSELLSSFQMRDLLEQLSRTYDHVLIDSPPLLLVADALELARMVDGVVLVARRNRVSSEDARELRALVERLDIHLTGVVFTDVTPAGSYGYGPYADGNSRPADLVVPAKERLAREEV